MYACMQLRNGQVDRMALREKALSEEVWRLFSDIHKERGSVKERPMTWPMIRPTDHNCHQMATYIFM